MKGDKGKRKDLWKVDWERKRSAGIKERIEERKIKLEEYRIMSWKKEWWNKSKNKWKRGKTKDDEICSKKQRNKELKIEWKKSDKQKIM